MTAGAGTLEGMSKSSMNSQFSATSPRVKSPMCLADRRCMMVTIAAWLVAWASIIVGILRSGLPADADLSILAFGIVFVGLAAAVLTVILVAIPLRIALNVVLKERRRSHRTETVVLTAVLAVALGYPLEVIRERNQLAPPRGVSHLPEFAKVEPPPRWLELVRHDGNDYVAWYGAHTGPFDVPSGPSCYLFDSKGEFIDWQAETGDGGPVETFLRSSSRISKISLEDALRLTQDSHASNGGDPR